MQRHIFLIFNIIVFTVNLITLCFVLFVERKKTESRVLWIMLLVFLPWVGFIFYILFSGHFFTGSKKMKAMNQMATDISFPARKLQMDYIASHKNKFPPHVLNSYYPLLDMNLIEGDSLLVDTATVDIYTWGEDFFDVLCRELENAKESINMEYFIFHQDKIGTKIMDILCRKAREGVKVKLIYDDLGSIRTRTKFFRQLNEAGGSARPFFLLRIGFPFTLNYRNHRKITVIDSRIGFIGGMNIGDEYANQQTKGKFKNIKWRDTTLRLTGNSVLSMQTNFLLDWFGLDAWYIKMRNIKDWESFYPEEVRNSFTDSSNPAILERTFTNLMDKKYIPTQIIQAGPDEAHMANIEDSLIRMIMSATKRVCLETPYFTPDEKFFTALRLAAYAGVQVDIIIPRDWDKFYMKAASYGFASNIVPHGVNIYLYPGFIHSKMIVVDGKICSVGTTNIDTRSFELHFEENALFYDKKLSLRMEKIFDKDLEISMKTDRKFFASASIPTRAFRSFCRLFSPLM